MHWLLAILVAILTAAAGAVGALFMGHLATGWFRVSEREGGRGYAIAAIGLAGLLGGLVLGLVVGFSASGFLPALGVSLGTTAAALGAILGLCWLRTEHPPRLDGKPLRLVVEVRGPPGEAEPAASPPERTRLILYARNRRRTVQGPLHPGGLRVEDGRWVVPGDVEIHSGRGRRLLAVEIGGRDEMFLIPLRGRPRNSDTAWTDWYPRPRPDGGPPVNALTYRYRVATPPPPPA